MIWTILGFGALGGVIACQLQHAGQHVRVILPRKFQSQANLWLIFIAINQRVIASFY